MPRATSGGALRSPTPTAWGGGGKRGGEEGGRESFFFFLGGGIFCLICFFFLVFFSRVVLIIILVFVVLNQASALFEMIFGVFVLFTLMFIRSLQTVVLLLGMCDRFKGHSVGCVKWSNEEFVGLCCIFDLFVVFSWCFSVTCKLHGLCCFRDLNHIMLFFHCITGVFIAFGSFCEERLETCFFLNLQRLFDQSLDQTAEHQQPVNQRSRPSPANVVDTEEKSIFSRY